MPVFIVTAYEPDKRPWLSERSPGALLGKDMALAALRDAQWHRLPATDFGEAAYAALLAEGLVIGEWYEDDEGRVVEPGEEAVLTEKGFRWVTELWDDYA